MSGSLLQNFENRTCDHSLVLAPYLLSDSLFQFFQKNNSRPLSSSSLTSSSD
jgi:hypothetical protein